jgi:hypothetical protein
LGSFYRRGLSTSSRADLARKLRQLVGNRTGFVNGPRETHCAYFHLEDTQYRIHDNCDCDWVRYLADNIEKAGGVAIGARGGKVLAIRDVSAYPDGYYIYHHR